MKKKRKIASLLAMCVAIGSMSLVVPAMAETEIITVGGTTPTYISADANGQSTPQVTLTPGLVTKAWSTSENNTIKLESGGTLNVQGYSVTNNNGILNAQAGNINLTGGNLTIGTGSAIKDAVVLKTSAGTVLNLTGGVVNLNGDNMSGSVNAQAGVLNINANTSIGENFNNALDLQNSKDLTVGGALINTGSIIGTGNLKIANGGSSSGSISQSIVDFTGGTFTNSSTLSANTSSKISTGATLINNGTYTVTGLVNDGTVNGVGTLNLSGVSSNATGKIITQSIVNVTDGTFTNKGTVTTNTTLSNSSTGIISNDGIVNTVSLNNSGSITNSTNDITKGTLNLNGDSTSVHINQVGVTIKQKDVSVLGGVFTNKGDVKATNVVNNAGIINDGSIAATNLNNNGDIINTNSIDAKKLTNAQGAYIENGKTIDTEDVINNGNIVNTDDGVINSINSFVNNGIVINSGSLNLTNLDNSNIIHGVIPDVSLVGNLVLSGNNNINRSGAYIGQDTLTLSENSVFTNYNQVLANTVTTEKNSSFANSGSVTAINFNNNGKVDNDGDINVKINLTNKQGGVINNNSAVSVNNDLHNATLINKGIINNTGSGQELSILNADILNNDDGVITLKKSILNVTRQKNSDIGGIINVNGLDHSNARSVLIIDDDGDLSTPIDDVPNFIGELNVGDLSKPEQKSTLLFMNGKISEDAQVNIAKGNTFFVLGKQLSGDSIYTTELSLDGDDNINGDLILGKGEINLNGVELSTGAKRTIHGGEKPFYRQVAGKLSMKNSSLTMDNASLISGGDLLLDYASKFTSRNNGFTVHNLSTGGLINAINGNIENYNILNNMYVGDSNALDTQADFAVDILARDYFVSAHDSFGNDNTTILADNNQNGTIHVSDWNFAGDEFGWGAPIERHFKIKNVFKGNVEENHDIKFTATKRERFTPIGWYRLRSTGGGDYSLNLTRFNPGVYRGQVSTLAQYQNQLAINDMIFNHTMLDQGFKGNDYIASNPNRYASANDLYAPYQYSRKDGGLWVKMYGNFEHLQMGQGLNVGNNAYGTIVGADFGLKDLKHGWQFMPTAFIAYNGGHQYWNGYGAYQNGGQAGFLGTWYKNDFMIGAMAYGGAYGNEMDTPRGTDNAFNYFAGASTRAAYNWKFANNWALQPNLLVSYNYFGQQNWHSAFGEMGMMSGMLHGVNVAPGLNLIYEKETFSVYATMQYVYNVNQSVTGRAGNVGLPNLSMNRGYMQYGIGVNKKFTDRFSGYFQGVLRNVGRNGIGVQMGFNYTLGKESKSATSKNTGTVPVLSPAKIDLKLSKK